jgi:uncharacterized protein YukJ
MRDDPRGKVILFISDAGLHNVRMNQHVAHHYHDFMEHGTFLNGRRR